MIVAVLNTNVLASGFAGLARRDSTPGELLRRWRAGGFLLVVSDPILQKLARTFRNPYFASRSSATEIEAAMVELRADALLQSLTTHVAGEATHAQDDQILATALSAQAPYLVTGDKPLLVRGHYQWTRLLSPREFLSVLENEALSWQ